MSYDETVEIVGGKFEGERGRVTNISHSEKKATVKVETGTVPFSVTVGMDEVKPIEEQD